MTYRLASTDPQIYTILFGKKRPGVKIFDVSELSGMFKVY